MSITRQIGIDFGTSTTVMRYKDYEKNKEVKVDLPPDQILHNGNPMIHTLIFETEDGSFIVGKEAEYHSGRGTLHTNLQWILCQKIKLF